MKQLQTNDSPEYKNLVGCKVIYWFDNATNQELIQQQQIIQIIQQQQIIQIIQQQQIIQIILLKQQLQYGGTTAASNNQS